MAMVASVWLAGCMEISSSFEPLFLSRKNVLKIEDSY
jgi:hypothetical protein